MSELSNYLKEARSKGHAIGHFNFSSVDVLRAIVEGAKEAGASAVMVGTSEGEADFLGLKEAVMLVKAARDEYSFPVFLNADHFKSVEKCQQAIDAGYDTVLFDGSKLSYEENLSAAQQVKAYAAGKADVEGEIGYLKGSSEIQEKVEISPADYTQPEQAQSFVQQTSVDRLAIVFGNIHGIVTQQEEHLDIEHLKKIVAAVPDTPLVLHGASGLKDEEVSAAIKAGISNVHFNTELRVAYTQGIEKAIHEGGKTETTPYKYMKPAADEVKKVVIQKIQLFQQ
ncbi:MAG: class II fructose-bisphosphate aldolase [Candidatus Yanofskybacteria bacterium]|nr:class II fructose-bisphosphate aldolase [Candidatus Yanofskybacteria bacterium]